MPIVTVTWCEYEASLVSSNRTCSTAGTSHGSTAAGKEKVRRIPTRSYSPHLHRYASVLIDYGSSSYGIEASCNMGVGTGGGGVNGANAACTGPTSPPPTACIKARRTDAP